MSLAILFLFLCAQHASDINIHIIRSLRLCCCITTSVVLFSVRCVLRIWCGWFWVVFVLQAEVQYILMSETCWAHKKWNKISSDMKLVFHSSTITMMHGPINISSDMFRYNCNTETCRSCFNVNFNMVFKTTH